MRLLLVLALGLAVSLGLTPRAVADNLEPGVWLEMAVLACQRGETAEMERLLRSLEQRFSPPQAITRFISSLRESGCPAVIGEQPSTTTQDPHSPPLGRFALGLGLTTNANSGPSVEVLTLSGLQDAQLVLDESFRPQRDAWFTMTAEREIVLAPLNRYGLSLGLSASGRWLREEQAFQELLWGGWLRGQWPLGSGVMLGSGLSVANSRLGQQSYARHAQWSGQLQWGALQDRRVDLSFHRVQYAQRDAFDAAVTQVGFAHDLRLPLGVRGHVRLAALSDKGQADRPGGDRKGWALQWSAERPAPSVGVWSVRAHLERSLSERAYAPGLIEERRDHKVSRVEMSWLIPHEPRQFWRVSILHRLERDAISLLGLREVSLGLEFNRLF